MKKQLHLLSLPEPSRIPAAHLVGYTIKVNICNNPQILIETSWYLINQILSKNVSAFLETARKLQFCCGRKTDILLK